MQHMFSVSFEDRNGISVVFDTKKNVVHVIEMDNGLEKQLTESFSDIQQCVLNRIEPFAHACEIRAWIVYGINGTVHKYEQGIFEKITLDHPEINSHFASKMKLRIMAVRSR